MTDAAGAESPPRPILWDDFAPGAALGAIEVTLSPDLFAAWARIDPGAGAEAAPPGLMTALMMRAYTAVVAPRPPGNVHAGQALRILRAPAAGAVLRAEFGCAGKEMRRGRRRVAFSVTMSDAEGPVLEGELRLVWAA